MDRALGQAQGAGDLAQAEAGEEVQLDHLHQFRIAFAQLVQGVVQRDQIDLARLEHGDCFVERFPHGTGPALRGTALPRMVHQHVAHRSGGEGEEVGAVAHLGHGAAEQAHVGLVHQGRDLQRVPARLALELGAGQPAQLVVDLRHQIGLGAAVAGPRTLQQGRDARRVGLGIGHAGAPLLPSAAEASDHDATMADRVPWTDVAALFATALDAPAGEREATVRQRAGADLALAREVLALLALHRDDGFLTPPTQPAGAEAHTAWAGRRLGDFRIVRLLGEGGMGLVFEAEQEQPHRRVALKVLRCSLGGTGFAGRFRAEAEILGRLQHPGIAQVHAAGSAVLEGTAEAVPFLALELVPGALPLTTFAALLPWRQRIELLLQVCDAVQHGHRRGVIHRDLKPQNVLVDADGRCKVVDFGIARLLDDSSAAATVPGLLLGTPAYMSPEQIAGDRAAIDVRCDGYALGVMLFQLATGTLPFAVGGLTPEQALHARLADPQPPPPSARARDLPRELDWIFAKAVARSPDERYGSVSEFAADLRRMLAGEAVQAGPPTMAYRLRTFVRRHRLEVAAVAAVLLAMVVALVVSLDSRAAAIAGRDRAQREQQVAEAVLRFVLDTLAAADPERADADLPVRDLVRDAAAELDAAVELPVLVRSGLEYSLGRTLVGLGLEAEAEPRLRRAHAGFLAEAGAHDRRTIVAGVQLAAALHAAGRTADAMAAAESAVAAAADLPAHDEARIGAVIQLAMQEMFVGAHDPAMDRLQAAAQALAAAGTLRTAVGVDLHLTIAQTRLGQAQVASARQHADQAVELATAVHGPAHPRTTAVRHTRARVMEAEGDFVAAERELREVIARSEASLGSDHRATLSSTSALGSLLRRQNRRSEASALFADLLATQRRLRGRDHPDSLVTQNRLALLLLDQQQLGAAEDLLRDGVGRARRLFEPSDPRLWAWLQQLAACRRRQSDHQEAEALLREAAALLAQHAGPHDLRTVQVRFNLGVLLRSRGAAAEAEPLVADAIEQRRAQLGPGHPDTLVAIHEAVRVQMALGNAAAAEPLARELLAGRRERGEAGGDDDDWLVAAQLLAQVLDRLGRSAEALQLHDEALAALGPAGPDRAVRDFNVRAAAAQCFVRHGRLDDARTLCAQNEAALAADPALGGDQRTQLVQRLRRIQADLDARR